MTEFHVIASDPRVERLCESLRSGRRLALAEGLWGSAAPILAALVAQRLGWPLLLVTPHVDEADDCRDDIETATGVCPDLLPPDERIAGEERDDEELASERTRLCLRVIEAARSSDALRSSAGGTPISPPPLWLVAPIHALMQPVASAAALASGSTEISVHQTLDPDALCGWLVEQGFTACEQVELPGDFARRGGIVDVFGDAYVDPVRIEFFGDQVDSIRLFTIGTQRSTHGLASVRIPGRRLGQPLRDARARSADTTGFLSLLPRETLIAFNEPAEIQELGRTYWQRLGERAGMIPADAIFRQANEFAQLHMQRFRSGAESAIDLHVHSLPQFEANTPQALRELHSLTQSSDVVVLCDNPPERQRLLELLHEFRSGGAWGDAPKHLGAGAAAGPAESPQAALDPASTKGVKTRRQPPPTPADPAIVLDARSPSALLPSAARPERIRAALGVIHRGFCWAQTCFLPHHELFRRTRARRTLRRIAPARPIDSFFDLQAGDPVVHVLHGIGLFRGLKTIEREDRRDEYLAIEFADRAVVHVSVSQIHLVQKYIGSGKARPRLSKLGGSAWKRSKERVSEAVTDLAAELLAIQAERATREGIAYPQDTNWQREFEGSFLYTETPDQLTALGEIKRDMTRPQPMDRLLCGDVGFGKTELAMRAAFKAVEYGKQVAVLVPTTVLAEQHFQTFRERTADYPFTIEVLSRFRSKAQQRKIVEAARKGQIDVLIGTHRLLSPDVGFADLGLMIIDEEQRFGVEAKERLKRLRATVDILTLSATPIPRTLHMAMLGIRDISTLATPPVDRRAIVTQVRMWDDGLLRDAILRELSRDGQVYFVHNFVRDIRAVAAKLQSLAPDARIVVGHGQMDGHELEEVMLKFLRRQADILVSTNIIESGIDIPTANTIFINRADRFGLADLHQLRGRVGRSHNRAYCYLLLSPKNPVKEVAARRLKAIEQYSDLGAGFQIAMRDLEIRGAGNILGPEQSGHIEAVGYEMYCQLLEQAARRLRAEPDDPWRPVNLDLQISATIPARYIHAERQRMEVYRRLAACRQPADVAVLRDDLRDGFGPLPPDVETLLDMAELRVLAQRWRVRSIVVKPPDVIFSFDDLGLIEPLFASGPGSPRLPDANTIHWRLAARLLEGPTLLSLLRQQLAGVGPARAAVLK